MTVVTSRVRSKPTVAAPKPVKPVWGHPVIGGPRDHMCQGFPIYSDGAPSKVWPYFTNVVLMGYRVSEYRHPKTGKRAFYWGQDMVYVGTHAWQLRSGELRYMGKFDSKDTALAKVEAAYARGQAEEINVKSTVTPVQPVAKQVRSRIRVSPSTNLGA